MRKLLITIDGPAGAGKTTVSRALADRLAYNYIDTGALYRGVAYEANIRGVSPEDDAGLEAMCQELDLRFIRDAASARLHSNGVDISGYIRSPEISMMASSVSARPVVRKALLEVQRKLGTEKAAVFEGRDMGTVVFPKADLKFFLTADLSIRALRRHRELEEKRAFQDFEEVKKDMARRDQNDSSRKEAPLRPADDAIMLDSTNLSVDEIIERMLDAVKKKITGTNN
jgi:cytidylate kinase